MFLVYIAGPYVGPHKHDHESYFAIHRNITNAHEASVRLARLGYGFFCPHTNSVHNEVIAPEVPVEFWYAMDLQFLAVCDAVLVLPGQSVGVTRELELARIMDIPVFYSIEAICTALPVQEVEVHAHGK